MNALKHGERSAERVESRRLANYALKLLREEGGTERRQTERLTNQEDWVQRIELELRATLLRA